jgi:hypothetical protein
MGRVAGRDSSMMDGRGGRPRQQDRLARGLRLAALLAPLGLPLAGCVGTPSEGPLDFFRNAFGDPLGGRPPPPGLDATGYPNLASVPPAPQRGAPSAREALSAALADARAQSREPQVSGLPVPPPPAGAESGVPLAPPAPPRLAAAPRVAPGTALPITPPGRAGQPDAVPADPGTAPALPPAEMLGIPPAPRL